MKKTALILGIIVGSLGLFAYGHGEATPGPHKGYVRMPGAFHTEVVPSGAKSFKVYLLDIEWKNPSVKDSKLEVKISNGTKLDVVACEVKEDFYSCTLPKGSSIKKGKLILNSSRENQHGNEVVYKLPLTFNGESH